MDGYTRSSYGDAFADVYDDWYAGVTDAEATADLVVALAGSSGDAEQPTRVLELAVGTGRLALPLAERGLEVQGVDASAPMLERLRTRDRDGRVVAILGDMVDDQPAGPFNAVVIAYNSLFNLESRERQGACFAAVAARLAPDGVLVVEAFVPEEPAPCGTVVAIRSMATNELVLSISEHDPVAQTAHGHLVQFVDGSRARLRPWAIRYAPPAELDAMAQAAGLRLVERWEDVGRGVFDAGSTHHVSVYGLARTT